MEDVKPKALTGPRVIGGGTGVTFTGVGVNDYCFYLSIGLIFGLIDGVSY